MADKSYEHEKLLLSDPDFDVKIETPEKSLNLNKTEETTLLELSSKVCEQDNTVIGKDNTTNDEKVLIEENKSKSNTDEIISKETKNNDNDCCDNDDNIDGKVKKKIIKRELQKSFSYDSSPADENKGSKKKVSHSMSVNPSALKAARTEKSINIAVFLKEGSGRLLLLENGKQTTAGEIKQMMINNLALPDESQNVFAIWLISPLLELQLKPQHIPFRLRQQWKGLLSRFTNAKDEEIEKDEPVMVFQRNSFLSITEEKKITDDRVIRRLFEEAKVNVLKGRYRIATGDAELLGAYLARIEHGRFNRDIHKIGFFKKSLQNYLPQSALRKQWLSKVGFTRSISTEQSLLAQYELASERADDPKKYYKLFLEFCWTLPFYGAAFFKGQVEQQSHDKYPWKHNTMNVSISIGREGITIFKEHKTEILLNLAYDELSWDYSHSDDCDDSFCIEYDTIDYDGKHVAKQLQIFSPQAAMMDALVDSCVAEMNRLKIPKSPTSPVFAEQGKPLADQGPPNVKKDQKRNFSLSNPFKLK